GILVHTLAFSNGGFLCHSIPDLKMDTIGNIFREYVPNDANVRTDEGYKFLTGIYKNHRMINHSLKSKDKRYRYSKDRWCNDGIHNQIAEGTQSVIKTAFRNYRYIRPEYSQLYLNEYSFISNIRSYGIGILIEQENVNKVAKRYLSHNLINQSS
ncbi:MAG: transposase, partial [Leptospiraceae bacterium]|nr:transposase [Leptospiraceae bacterium]